MNTKNKTKLVEFKFTIVNMASDKDFNVFIKGKNYDDAKRNLSKKFPYPKYKLQED